MDQTYLNNEDWKEERAVDPEEHGDLRWEESVAAEIRSG